MTAYFAMQEKVLTQKVDDDLWLLDLRRRCQQWTVNGYHSNHGSHSRSVLTGACLWPLLGPIRVASMVSLSLRKLPSLLLLLWVQGSLNSAALYASFYLGSIRGYLKGSHGLCLYKGVLRGHVFIEVCPHNGWFLLRNLSLGLNSFLLTNRLPLHDWMLLILYFIICFHFLQFFLFLIFSFIILSLFRFFHCFLLA